MGGILGLISRVEIKFWYPVLRYISWKEIGSVRVAILYTISGMRSSLFSALFIPTNVSVGASGAIMGLVGGTLTDLTLHLHPNKSIWTLIGSIIIRLGLGLIIPQANNFGIIGGLITGILLRYVLLICQTHSPSSPY